MNTNWNPHSLQSMMYTNHHAMTMNPYFMANPNSMMMANQMQMMGGAGAGAGAGVQHQGVLPYNGNGFEQSYMQNGDMGGPQGQNENEVSGENMMVI